VAARAAPITASYVNRDRYSWSATLTVLVVPLLNRRSVAERLSVRSERIEISCSATYFACEITSLPTTALLSPSHVGKPRKMQLVSNSHRLGRAVAVLGHNQVRLTAAGIVAVEGIGPVQQDDHIRILFKTIMC
jgi:hypothetical protein